MTGTLLWQIGRRFDAGQRRLRVPNSDREEILMGSSRHIDEGPNELGSDPGQVGPDSGGQSGDTQGLSPIADAADESVEDLADSGQAYEAEVVEGVEDAADHPARPVHTHEDQVRPRSIAPDGGSE
jgi:hypothetical protein